MFDETVKVPTFLAKALENLQNRVVQHWTSHDIVLRHNVTIWLKNFIIVGVKLGYFNAHNYENVAEALEEIYSINELPAQCRSHGIYSCTREKIENNKKLYFNSKLLGGLSILYLYHEVCHCLVFRDKWAFKEFYNRDPVIWEQQAYNPASTSLIIDGAVALEEFVVQEIAEDIFYAKYRYERPVRREITNPIMFGEHKGQTRIMDSRLLSFGELEPIVLSFADTLRNVGNPTFHVNHEKYLRSVAKDFCIKALDENCCKDIVTEYKMSEIRSPEIVLANLLHAFGYVANAKFQAAGSHLSIKDGTIDKNVCNDRYDYILDTTSRYANDDRGRKVNYQKHYPKYFITKEETEYTDYEV